MKATCTVPKCQGEVKFGSSRTPRYCRRHEGLYLTDEEVLTEDTLRSLSSRIGIRDDGCWQVEQAWGDGVLRPTVKSAGLQWRVVRLLYVYFFGGHKGGLELGHTCHQEWCVHPGHVMPVSGAGNRKDRDVLNANYEKLSPRDKRRHQELTLEADIISAIPAEPGDVDAAHMLRKFTATLGRALPEVVTATVPAPPVPPAAPKTKAKASLFIDHR